MPFKDHFSTQAADYAKYRPHYPPALFEYLASIAPAKKVAWDCGTGNGQAALGLALHFEMVIATDPSEKQIRNFTCLLTRNLLKLESDLIIPNCYSSFFGSN